MHKYSLRTLIKILLILFMMQELTIQAQIKLLTFTKQDSDDKIITDQDDDADDQFVGVEKLFKEKNKSTSIDQDDDDDDQFVGVKKLFKEKKESTSVVSSKKRSKNKTRKKTKFTKNQLYKELMDSLKDYSRIKRSTKEVFVKLKDIKNTIVGFNLLAWRMKNHTKLKQNKRVTKKDAQQAYEKLKTTWEQTKNKKLKLMNSMMNSMLRFLFIAEKKKFIPEQKKNSLAHKIAQKRRHSIRNRDRKKAV